jgi:hypothetical protein
VLKIEFIIDKKTGENVGLYNVNFEDVLGD